MYNPNENRFTGPESRFDRHPTGDISRMAGAALCCGILGVILSMTGWFAIIFGALAVLFARLSRGEAYAPSRQARLGFVIGIIAMIIGCVSVIWSFRTIIINYGSITNYYNLFMEQYNNIINGSSQML